MMNKDRQTIPAPVLNNTMKMETTMMSIRRIPSIRLAVLAVLLLATHLAAMPGPAHILGAKDLIGIPVENGGVGNMSVEMVKKIMDFMDHPTRDIGKYRLANGQLLTPNNHANLYHNPANVARVWHVSPEAVKNVARLHKIQDVAHNAVGKAQVDGWVITENMQKQAQDILRHLRRHKGLPKHFPRWVDQQGPNIAKTAAKTAAGSIISHAPHVLTQQAIGNAMRSAVWTTAARAIFDTGTAMILINRLEDLYDEGAISRADYLLAYGKVAGGTIGRIAGSFLATTASILLVPLGPIGIMGALVVGPILVWGGETVGEFVGKQISRLIIAWEAYQYRLDFAAYSKAMKYMLNLNLPPDLFDRIERLAAYRDAYRKCWGANPPVRVNRRPRLPAPRLISDTEARQAFFLP